MRADIRHPPLYLTVDVQCDLCALCNVYKIKIKWFVMLRGLVTNWYNGVKEKIKTFILKPCILKGV